MNIQERFSYLFCLVGVILVGCATRPDVSSGVLWITAKDDVTVLIAGQKVPAVQLASQLKSWNIPPTIAIRVKEAQNLTEDGRRRVSTVLASAGYRRLLFIGARTATVTEVKPPVQQPPAARAPVR